MKQHPFIQHRGMALVSGLLLLLVITIIGLGMFRSIATDQKIAGNTREKERALHAANGAQAYAEWWVSQPGGGNSIQGVDCTGLGLVTISKAKPLTVCNTALDDATVTGTWLSNKATVGFIYTIPLMNTTAPTKADYYAQSPMVYVAYLNGAYDKSSGTFTFNYRVDASGGGGNANTVAVVESVYQTQVTDTTQLTNTKFYSLTGP
jgi:type IV pilus assembly protein PilX